MIESALVSQRLREGIPEEGECHCGNSFALQISVRKRYNDGEGLTKGKILQRKM